MGIHWDSAAVADLCIFCSCCALFLGYHVWLFFLRPVIPIHRQSYFDIFSASHKSRGLWAEELVEDTRDALQTYGIQTLRNGITAASFLATACSLIAVQGILPSLLDQSRIDRLDSIAANDPITRGPGLFDPTTKLAIGEFVILFSFLAFAQSIRMMNHLGFYMRVVPSKRNVHAAFRHEEAIAMSLRAATTFTVGFRAFYAFIPLLLWLFGPTSLLCSTVLEVFALWLTDTIKRKPVTALDLEGGNGAAAAAEASAGGAQRQQEQQKRAQGQGQGQGAAGGDVEMGLSNGRSLERESGGRRNTGDASAAMLE